MRGSSFFLFFLGSKVESGTATFCLDRVLPDGGRFLLLVFAETLEEEPGRSSTDTVLIVLELEDIVEGKEGGGAGR